VLPEAECSECGVRHGRVPVSEFTKKQGNMNHDAWFADCQRRISRRWGEKIDALSDKPITCTFRLDSKGEVNELKIVRSSKIPEIDEAALAFIRKAAPLRVPAFKEALEKTITVQFLKFPQTKVRLGSE